MASKDRWLRFGLKPLLFAACLMPFGLLAKGAFEGDLGANPVETVTFATGDWGLRFLLITLAVTPLRTLTGWGWPLRLRRMLGLFAYFYASLHLLTYFWLDQFFDWPAIAEDILKRPYVTVGFTAWLLLTPLAATSTRAAIRRLGRRWAQLHQLVYPAALAVVFHFLWLVKADSREPLIYASVFALLMICRHPWARQQLTGWRKAPFFASQ